MLHIPTEADLLSLATNDILEIGGGDVVTATYIDDLNQTGSSRLLTAQFTATYHNASITPITYDFLKDPNGEVTKIRKDLLRIDPGERVVIEVTDFDQDTTAGPDKIKVQVAVNDGPAIDLEAIETNETSGIFTKEVDTSPTPAEGKIVVKAGDRIYLRYLDEQNTVPGHAAIRETVVYAILGNDVRPRDWNEPKCSSGLLEDVADRVAADNLLGKLAEDADLTILNNEFDGVLVLPVNPLAQFNQVFILDGEPP